MRLVHRQITAACIFIVVQRAQFGESNSRLTAADFYPAVTSRRLSLAGTAWPTDPAERADQKSSPELRHNHVPTETPDLQPFQPPEQ